MKIAVIVGSLRKDSWTRKVANAMIDLAPKSLSFDHVEISALPHYSQDLETDRPPAEWVAFRDRIRTVDGVLFATPEYNRSVPGVLKNAIDWASRPPNQPFAGKPFAVMGASGGMGGTMRMQYHLRQIAVFLDMHAVNKPECFVRNAAQAFDAEGNLTDEATKKVVKELVDALVKEINARRR